MAQTQTGAKNKIIGIDLGTAAVKIACGELRDGVVRVTKVAFRQIVGLDAAGAEAYAAIVKEMIAENQITGDSAIFVLNGPQCLVRIMTLPKMSDELLEKTIRSELKKELNIPLEEYKIDFKACREFEVRSEEGINQKKIEAIVTVVDDRVIEKYKRTAELAGLKCEGFVPAAAGLYSYSKKAGLLSELAGGEVIMFLDFGNSQMSVSFIGNNGLRFSKEINMGGSALTTVVKTMHPGESLSMEASEEKKFRIGLMAQEAVDALDDSAPNANLHKVLNLSFKKLFQRIRLSTGYYFAHFRDSALSSQVMKKIYLAGGNAEIPGISAFFDEAFDASVAKADSWAGCDNGECNLSLCERYNLSFFNLCAAFSEYFLPEYNLNFTAVKVSAGAKPRVDNEAKFNEFIASNAPALQGISNYKFTSVALTALAFYFMVFASIGVYDALTITSLNSQKKVLDAKYSVLNSPAAEEERKKAAADYEAFLKKKNAKEIICFQKYSLDRVLANISACLPDGAIVSAVGFAAENAPVLTLTGTASEYGKVIKFSDELKKNKAFERVTMKRSEQRAGQVEFQFDCEMAVVKAR